MNGYGFFRSIQLIVGLGFMILTGAVVIGFNVWIQISRELTYRNRFGGGWREEFEKDFYSVAAAHTRVALGVFGLLAIGVLLVWLYRGLKRPDGHGRKRRHSHESGSPLERVMRHRRRAVVGVYFGVIGILVGVFLSLVRVGLFADHANEVVVGIFVFLGGFCGVMIGCSAWLKAKGWNEAIVFIGVMPLAVLFVPFVRIIVLTTGILPVAMVLMPLSLVVVVFVLPDRSGVSRRRRGGL